MKGAHGKKVHRIF